jgi:glycerol-3-phosphate dehydrogenase
MALEAARRGLKVALLERGDLGAATSANSLRLIHGGLRHLKRLDLKSCRKYVTEQRAWLRETPDMFRPLRCLVSMEPGFSLKHLPYVVGLSLYNLLAWDRNRGLPSSVQLPAAGFDKDWQPYWYDAQMVDPTGLVTYLASTAQSHGATFLLGHEVQKLNLENGRIVGAECLELASGRPLSLTGRFTATALGPWTNRVLLNSDLRPVDVDWMQGINVSLDLQLSTDALVLSDIRGRRYFVAPLQRGSMAGTGQYPLNIQPEDWSCEQLDPESFLSELEALHPALEGCRDKVLQLHRGLIPAKKRGGVVTRQSDILLDRSRERGLICLVAAKYSSARKLAELAVSKLH